MNIRRRYSPFKPGSLQLAGTSLALTPAPESSGDTILQVDLRILGSDVLPFNGSKQNAVIVGVANVLGNAVPLSGIQLTVLQTYDVSPCLHMTNGPAF